MSYHWLKKESKRWVEKGIVSEEQQESILDLYPAEGKSRFFKLLPMLGSILLGLSLLTFIASNWEQMNDFFKLILIIAFMLGFYLFGNYFMGKNNSNIGLPLIGLGVITFGAGIILLGQTFHLIAYDARAFIFWGLAGIVAAYFYRSRFLFLIPTAILTSGQFYNLDTFQHFSFFILLMTIVLLGYLWYSLKSRIVSFAIVISLMCQFAIIPFTFSSEEDLLIFLGLIPLLFYLIGEALKKESYTYPFQFIPLTVGFIYTLFLSFVGPNNWLMDFDYLTIYLAITLLLVLATLFLKYRSNELNSAYQFILFACFVLPFIPNYYINAEIAYVIYLFIFSLMVLLHGYQFGEIRTINLGTILFIFTTMAAYFNLASEFMSKSLLFLTGGIILIGLHFFLQKKKNELFNRGGK